MQYREFKLGTLKVGDCVFPKGSSIVEDQFDIVKVDGSKIYKNQTEWFDEKNLALILTEEEIREIDKEKAYDRMIAGLQDDAINDETIEQEMEEE